MNQWEICEKCNVKKPVGETTKIISKQDPMWGYYNKINPNRWLNKEKTEMRIYDGSILWKCPKFSLNVKYRRDLINSEVFCNGIEGLK